jgi:hypothetical protein
MPDLAELHLPSSLLWSPGSKRQGAWEVDLGFVLLHCKFQPAPGPPEALAAFTFPSLLQPVSILPRGL